MMKRSGPLPACPDEYVRAIALRVGGSDETVKWGHLVYLANGPAFLIRAEGDRVLFGFWRGKRLLDIEPRMTGGGKYEMKTLDLREETPIDPAVAERLMREAIRLNLTIGNPQERK